MTKTKNNTQRANLTLGGIALGFLFSYPFHASYVGGLISSGCSAGMIGGLADWFAVTALFRRPLGIKPGKILRTEIIPQNRERIFAALADMVQHELLSQDALRSKLSTWDFSGALIQIFGKPEVQHSSELLLRELAEEVGHQFDPEALKRQLQGLSQDNLESLKLCQTLAEVLEFSGQRGDVDQVIKAICRSISDYVEQPEVKSALMNTLEAALTRYGENNPTRKMVLKFLPAPAVLAHGLQAKIKEALEDGTVERWLLEALQHFVQDLKTKSTLQARLNLGFLGLLSSGSDTLQMQSRKGASLRTSPGRLPLLGHFAANLQDNWEEYLRTIEHNHDLRLKVDEAVKGFLEKQIGYHHNAIGRMVREGLEPLTNDKLVELIEDKAGNDLQIIRINGSVVGALVGMLIYVLGMVLA